MIAESNLPFQVVKFEVHEIDLNVIVDENIPLCDSNWEANEMVEPTYDNLLLEHHELEEDSREDEGERNDETE